MSRGRSRALPAGIFLLPIILMLIGAAKLASTVPFSKEIALEAWVGAHILFFVLGYVAVIYGFVVGVMYLIQASRLKRKLPPIERFHLPALEWLERANQRATVLAAILITLGCCFGHYLEHCEERNHSLDRSGDFTHRRNDFVGDRGGSFQRVVYAGAARSQGCVSNRCDVCCSWC